MVDKPIEIIWGGPPCAMQSLEQEAVGDSDSDTRWVECYSRYHTVSCVRFRADIGWHLTLVIVFSGSQGETLISSPFMSIQNQVHLISPWRWSTVPKHRNEIPLFCGFGQGQGISSQERLLSNLCFAIRKDECCGTAARQGPPTNVD